MQRLKAMTCQWVFVSIPKTVKHVMKPGTESLKRH